MNTNGKRRLMRPTEGRMVAGVANGLARHFGFDPTIVRIAFALLTLLGFGTAILAYLVLWVVMPDQARLSDEEWEEAPAFEGEIDHRKIRNMLAAELDQLHSVGHDGGLKSIGSQGGLNPFGDNDIRSSNKNTVHSKQGVRWIFWKLTEFP